jgi:hypothetical protein
MYLSCHLLRNKYSRFYSMKNKPLPTFEAFINEDFIKPEAGKRRHIIKMPSGKYYAGDTGSGYKEVEKENAWPYFNQSDAQKAANSVGGAVETIKQVS